MGFFDKHPYDLNGDGHVDGYEFFVGAQLMAGSRQEALDLTGDDSFYPGDDGEEGPDDHDVFDGDYSDDY